jgi:integrase
MDRSTILRLKRSQLTERGIEFTRSKTEATREEPQLQVIRWTPELRMIIDRLLTEPPRFRTALICTQTGDHYTADGFKTLWHRLIDRAVKGRLDWEGTVVEPPVVADRFHFHDLRAKSASDAVSDQAAADRLGHRSVALTQRIYRRLPRLADPQAMPAPLQGPSTGK